jgi:lysozyme
MTKKDKQILTALAISTIVLFMLRKRIATYLNKTPFGAISDRLFNFIGKLEGFTPVAEWDFKQYSIGYGTGYNWDEKRAVQKGDIIDKETAKRWLLKEAEQEFNFVKKVVKVPVTDNQLLALASFTYNIGQGAFQKSTLLRLLNEGYNKQAVASEFDKWVYAGGQKSKGLANRRAAEKQLFLS